MNRDKFLIGIVLPVVIWGIATVLIFGVFLLPSQVAPPEEEEIVIPTGEVDLLLEQRKSIMPELQLKDMTAQEVADLLSFLESLK